MVGPLQLEDLPLRQLAREHDPFENLFIPRSGTQRRGAPRLAWHAPLGTSAARPLSRSKARMVSFPTHAAYVLVFHDRICCLGDRCACRRGDPHLGRWPRFWHAPSCVFTFLADVLVVRHGSQVFACCVGLLLLL